MNQVYMLGNIPEITGIYAVYQSYVLTNFFMGLEILTCWGSGANTPKSRYRVDFF